VFLHTLCPRIRFGFGVSSLSCLMICILLARFRPFVFRPFCFMCVCLAALSNGPFAKRGLQSRHGPCGSRSSGRRYFGSARQHGRLYGYAVVQGKCRMFCAAASHLPSAVRLSVVQDRKGDSNLCSRSVLHWVHRSSGRGHFQRQVHSSFVVQAALFRVLRVHVGLSDWQLLQCSVVSSGGGCSQNYQKGMNSVLLLEAFGDFAVLPVGIALGNALNVGLLGVIRRHSLQSVPGVPFGASLKLHSLEQKVLSKTKNHAKHSPKAVLPARRQLCSACTEHKFPAFLRSKSRHWEGTKPSKKEVKKKEPKLLFLFKPWQQSAQPS
jgi:hypothetical protein